jgi:hypothetical protein
MNDHPDLDDDDGLAAALASTLGAVPLDEEFADRVRAAAWSTRSLDADLLHLVSDSLVDAAAVRGDDAERLLRFEGAGYALDVTIDRSLELIGVVSPPELGLELETADGTTGVDVDELGRFRAPVTTSRFRFIVTSPDRVRLMTPWTIR